jgi:hypothetical protein
MRKLISLCLLLSGALLAHAQGPTYPYSVVNNWTDSISKNAVGYFVYRAPYASGACGVFAKLFTTALPSTATSYTDPNPAEGAYCYAATAVNSGGVESGLSNVSSNVNVPLPPPTNFGAVVAKYNSQEDVIYAWINPPGTKSNSIYCNGKPAVKLFFPTTKVRVTTPSGVSICGVTASSASAESGLSKTVKVSVP